MLEDKAAEIMAATRLNYVVVYEGKPVWIESVNRETHTAEVVMLVNNEKQQVPVAELRETGIIGMLDAEAVNSIGQPQGGNAVART